MKRIIYFLFVFIISGANAQIPTQEIDGITILPEQKMFSIFQNLDLTQVPSGLLIDKGFAFCPVEKYNGTLQPDNKVKFEHFDQLYTSMFSAAVDMAHYITHPDVAYKTAMSSITQSSVIPILIEHFNFHKIKSTAIADNLISVSNEQLYDVLPRPSSPYQVQTAFAATSAINYATTLSLQFKVNSAYIFNNTGKTISTVQIDFDNGNGFQTVTINNTLNITYPSDGEKTLVVKVIYTDGTIIQSHSVLKIDSGSNLFFGFIPDEVWQITDAKPFNGIQGTAKVSIAYGCGNDKLVKPLIIVEGFDPPQFGNFLTYNSFIQKLTNENLILKQELENGGYDLVYIDFSNGSDYIQRNAYIVEKVIQMVNNEKTLNGSYEQNVVLGMSMGGICARYALRDMEITGVNHDTKKFISFDSPHLGANVPLGFQYMVKDQAETEIKFNIGPFNVYSIALIDKIPALKIGVEILNSPAAKQMLIYQAYKDYSLRAQLLADAAFTQQPQSCERIAISNGSEKSIGQPYSAGAQLLYISGDNFSAIGIWGILIEIFLGTGFHLDYEVYALPDNPANFEKIYHARIHTHVLWIIGVDYRDVTVKIKQNKPLDNAPGGIEDVSTYTGEIDFNDLPASVSFYYTTFCFIPTISALDIINPYNQNFFYDVSNHSQIISSGKTTFNDYSAVTGIVVNQNNELHLALTIENNNILHNKLIDFYNSISTVAALPTASGATYNFGKNYNYRTTDRITNSLSINNGGVLSVNQHTDLEFPGSGLGNPTSNSTFSVFVTSGCSAGAAVITIENGGVLRVGDISVGNKGNLFFRPGSTLILKNNSRIIVEEFSKLIIEAGASVSIQPGAIIELRGANSLFDIKGTFGNAILATGEQIIFTKGWASTGGLAKFANGTLTMNPGSKIFSDGCRIELISNANLIYNHDAIFELSGSDASVKVFTPCTININSGEKFIANSGSSSTGGTVQFSKGTFILAGNGIIENTNCTVSNISNSVFNYAQNAIVNLNTDNSVLELGGTVNIAADAIFKYSLTPNSGFIRFYYATVNGGVNSEIYLNGNGKSIDKIVEIHNVIIKPTVMRMILSNGLAEMHGTLSSECLSFISNMHVTSPTYYNTIEFFGQRAFVNNSIIENANKGLADYLVGTNNFPLIVSNSIIRNCAHGIFTSGVGNSFTGVTFQNNDYGMVSDGTIFHDVVTNCTFTNHNSAAVWFGGQSGATIKFYDCVIENPTTPGDYGVWSMGGTTSYRCGKVNGHTKNIGNGGQSSAGFYVTDNGILNLSTTMPEASGFVDVSNNFRIIEAFYANTLCLTDGFNNFLISGGQDSKCHWLGATCKPAIIGNIYPNAGCPLTIVADQNYWDQNINSYGKPINPHYNDLNCGTGNPYSDVIIEDMFPLNFPASCPAPPNPCLPFCSRNALINCPTCPLLFTANFTGVKLNEAILFAINKMDSTIAIGYKTAVNLLYEIIDYPSIIPDAINSDLLKTAYRQIQQALYQAVRSGQVPVSDAYIANEVNKVFQIQDSLIAAASGNERMYLMMDKAFVYRLIDRRNQSLAIINALISQADSSNMDYLNHWLCLIDAEEKVRNGIISNQEYAITVSSCGIPAARTMNWTAQESINNNSATKNNLVYPNPSSGDFTFEFKNINGKTSISILDLTGKLVLWEEVTNPKFTIRNPQLTPGLYLYEIKNESGELLRGKLVKN